MPGYHFLLSTILLVNLGFAGVALVRGPSAAATVQLAVAIGLVLLFWYARAFAVTVQDRVIRLEETLRMERLLPPDLKPRIAELSRRQFVALRFASDPELPDLVRTVLDERIASLDEIKRRIRVWRPDNLRA